MNLVLVLGDQLDLNSSAFDGFDPAQDVVWMAEVHSEAVAVWSHKARIALFLSAMRHFRDALRERGWTVDYQELKKSSLGAELKAALKRHKPEKVVMVEPGEYRVREELLAVAPIEIRPDRHFLSSVDDFREHAKGRKQLRMEYFYREMRRRYGYLMDGAQPEGGDWNYDEENRGAFPKSGPGTLPAPRRFPPDALTQEVLALVEQTFPQHPGKLQHFDWPVTAAQAHQALEDFVAHRLGSFGTFQDAMWTGEPWLYHSRISTCLNLKLLDPREACMAAEDAYRRGQAPLAAVEGFIRQILGWREYVRGIYWLYMPEYLERNALAANQPLPKFYWTGETDMECLRQAIGQTLEYGYAHHIQRLMVTGLFALLLGVEPKQVHEWYLAVYVDAVEWVELPNTLGMSQFADGGVMASKPYAATGKYIDRMSNYCRNCVHSPEDCAFTALYWDFLLRNEEKLKQVGRMDMQLRNLVRISPAKKQAMVEKAKEWKEKLV
ncbi:MAG: cryptochrome/photolyase family protein [Bryobacter sp.]